MHYKRLFISLISIVTLLLLAAVKPLHAAPSLDDEVVLGDDLTLYETEHIDGDLVVIGGNLTMRAGSRVEGSATAVGGRVEVDGTIEGDLVALGGDVNLGTHAHIKGETVALGGKVRKAEGAQTGKIVEGLTFGDAGFWRNLRPSLFFQDSGSGAGLTTRTVVTTLIGAVFLALLGIAIVAFWPAQTALVGETILTAPLPSLGTGCLLYPLTVSLVVVILITVCLAPAAPVVVLLVVAASLLGWVALGMLWGRRLVRWAGWREATPLAAAGVGVFTLTMVAAVLGSIPCVGFILILGAASIGLGAVALSRFGTSRHRHRPIEPPAEA